MSHCVLIGQYTSLRLINVIRACSCWLLLIRILFRVISDRQNRVSLETIQSSLFIVCLDAANPSHLSHLDPVSLNRQTVAALQCIHGNGARANATNRWYDKCVQFVVGAEGNVGITYEHSPAEGVPVARMMDFLVSERSRISAGSQSQWSQIAAPQRLDFSVDAQIETELQRAGDDLQMYVYLLSLFLDPLSLS